MDNLIQKSIESFEERTLTSFKPRKEFYETLGINRIRFWQLVKGTKDPKVDEAESIANYFGFPAANFFNQTTEAQAIR
jgi:hypothetical protein